MLLLMSIDVNIAMGKVEVYMGGPCPDVPG